MAAFYEFERLTGEGRAQSADNRMNTSQAKSREYGTAALKGWAALHTNAPVNLINGLTEPLRGVAALGGAYIPSVPRWEAMEKSEYWQAGNKGQVAEVAGTLAAGVLAGGSTVLATTPGKVIATLEAIYKIGVGVAGVSAWRRSESALSCFVFHRSLLALPLL